MSLRVAAGLGHPARRRRRAQGSMPEKSPCPRGLRASETVYGPITPSWERLAERAREVRRRHPDRLPFHAVAHADRRRPPPYEPIAADIVIGDRYAAGCDAAIAHRVHAFLAATRLPRRAQQTLCRRLHHRALRRPRARTDTPCRSRSNRALYMDEKDPGDAAGLRARARRHEPSRRGDRGRAAGAPRVAPGRGIAAKR